MPDSYAVVAGTQLTVQAPGVLANDTDSDSPSRTAVRASDPAHGSLALNPDGSFTYVPNADFAGTDSFSYRASDGTTTSDPVTVTVSVTATRCGPRPRVQSQPVAGAGRLSVHVEASPLGTQEANHLLQVEFGQVQNARVTLNGRAIGSGQSVSLPANTRAVDFTVERVASGQATTVPFTVVDDCGSWPTFVGGGTAAGF